MFRATSAILLFPALVFAQSITGVVKDATGAPIAGAIVKVANQQTGVLKGGADPRRPSYALGL